MELHTYVRILSRRRLYLLVGVLFGLVVASVLMGTATKTYESQAQVFFTSATNRTDSEYQGRQFTSSRMNTYAELATSNVVLAQVIDELQLSLSSAELASQVTAEPTPGTVLVTIMAKNTDANTARRIAQVVAESLVDLAPRLEGTSGAKDPAIRATISDPATSPRVAASGRPTQAMILAPLLGLLLSAGLVVIREVMSPTVGLSDPVRDVTDVPVLGAIPRTAHSARQAARPGAARDEALTVLAMNLRHRARESGATTLVMMGAHSRQGNSSVPYDVTASLSRAGMAVAFVDANLRGIGDADLPGLSDVLRSEVALEEALRTDESRSTVLASGSPVSEPADLLQSSRSRDVFASFRDMFDMVVVASPPALPTADAALVAQLADATVLVVRPEHTKSADLRGAIDRLASVGIAPIGVILEESTPRR